MNKDYLNKREWSEDDLIIKILEFVCKHKDIKAISAQLVQRDLFPELGENEILHLFAVIKQRGISQVTVIGKYKVYLRYEVGLEQYIKTLNTMTKNEKLHKIVEFLSTSYSPEKQSFESGEIAKAFIPELNIYEINDLCGILIANDDVYDVTTNESDAKSMVAVLVTTKTHNAYHNKRYLNEEEKQFVIPSNQNIFNVHNLSYAGRDINGKIEQEVKSESSKKVNGKPKWLKYLLWILGAFALILGIIEAIINIF